MGEGEVWGFAKAAWDTGRTAPPPVPPPAQTVPASDCAQRRGPVSGASFPREGGGSTRGLGIVRNRLHLQGLELRCSQW